MQLPKTTALHLFLFALIVASTVSPVLAADITLAWDANSEPDLAGYNVYRREAQEPARRMNEGLLRTPLLRDSTVEPGRSYTYWVTAVDLTGNESLPSPVASVETQ